MTWTRLSDDHFDKPRIARLSRSARLLDVEVKVWCNKVLSDGLIPEHMLRRVTDSPDVNADAAELVKAKLWRAISTDDGTVYETDWSDQRLAEAVREEAKRHADRQARYSERVKKHAAGDHTLCDRRYCRNAVTDGVSDSDTDNAPTRPDPTRPLQGRGRGRGGTGDARFATDPTRPDGRSVVAPRTKDQKQSQKREPLEMTPAEIAAEVEKRVNSKGPLHLGDFL
jgi:hypothetical protein